MDAFVIRGTLVPAFMRLAGNANWWAPAPLRRFHDRYGISEHVDLDAELVALTAERPVPRVIRSGESPDAERERVTMSS
jgi:RND superfamily putative drug exporter